MISIRDPDTHFQTLHVVAGTFRYVFEYLSLLAISVSLMLSLLHFYIVYISTDILVSKINFAGHVDGVFCFFFFHSRQMLLAVDSRQFFVS